MVSIVWQLIFAFNVYILVEHPYPTWIKDRREPLERDYPYPSYCNDWVMQPESASIT